MVFRSLLKHPVLFITLFCWIVGSHSHLALAQSAWLANHFMANKIERVANDTAAITEYPIICSLSGPGPYNFDSYTQIITARGKHKIRIQIVQDATNKVKQINGYTIDAGYDGYIDGHICNWRYIGKQSGWYKMEIVLDNGSKNSEVVGTFYFYIHCG